MMDRTTFGASKLPYTYNYFQGHTKIFEDRTSEGGAGGTSLVCFPPSKKDPINFLDFFRVRLQDDGMELNRFGVYFGEHQHIYLEIQFRFCKRGSISGV